MNIRAAFSIVTSLLIAVVALAWPGIVVAHQSGQPSTLRKIGPAPDFRLTTQAGSILSLVVVSFIFTSCADTCSLLTEKLATVQDRLGKDFGAVVRFVSITLKPDSDGPGELQHYAQAMGVDLAGWTFLTGHEAEIDRLASEYGVISIRRPNGDIEHNLTTSIIDGSGFLRVQYIGERFDEGEFYHDLRDLIGEVRAR